MNATLTLALLLMRTSPPGPVLDLPPRSAAALAGVEFARSTASLSLQEREEAVLAQVRQGNVPTFLRTLVPVTVSAGSTNATYHVAPDYLAIGSDDDYVLFPLTPTTAQKIADMLGCSLPTPRIVDQIYRSAAVRLKPSPIAPSAAMTTVPVFLEHDATIRGQRGGKTPGALVAGHKKDVVICRRIVHDPGKVAIYGWHKLDGLPIQPLYTGHTAAWVDYSHGIRLVHRTMTVNSRATTLDEVLADPKLAPLLSHEGVVHPSRYAVEPFPADRPPAALPEVPGETTEVVRIEPGVRVVINRPSEPNSRPVLLIVYALPNGNTIEQTIGRAIAPGDDWHFDIQHIGAQTRFLRAAIRDRSIVVAYLENSLRSWPAWRKAHGDETIPALLDSLRARFPGATTRIVLAGHSGGGSLIFGYLNRVERIPDHVERIALLDANYAYETGRHRDKLAAWLGSSGPHSLCVLAYNDAVALLNGKTFVSAEGGTWGRSHVMLRDLDPSFAFASVRSGDLRRVTALDGRVTFLLKENPEKAILHTVQVERNGFIESILSGTSLEGAGYRYLGDRAYTTFIRAD